MTETPAGQECGDDEAAPAFEISFAPNMLGTRVTIDGHEYPDLADVRNREMLLAIARHPDCPNPFLSVLAHVDEVEIREAVGAHLKTPSKDLNELAHDSALIVRAAVAGNSATDPLTLEDLGQPDRPSRQLVAVAVNDSTPTETLKALARHVNIDVAREASQTLLRRGIEVDTPSANEDTSDDDHAEAKRGAAQLVQSFLKRLSAELNSGSDRTVSVDIGGDEKVTVSRAASELIFLVYLRSDESERTIRANLAPIALGEGARALGIKTLGSWFPSDFEGVDDLLVGMSREVGLDQLGVTEGDTRSPAEIVHDDAVIAEHILRKNKARSGDSRLVVGKGDLRRRWVGLGQELGVGPIGGGWVRGDPPEGEEIFEPFDHSPVAAVPKTSTDKVSQSPQEKKTSSDTEEEGSEVVTGTEAIEIRGRSIPLYKGPVTEKQLAAAVAKNGMSVAEKLDLLITSIERFHALHNLYDPEQKADLREIRQLAEALRSSIVVVQVDDRSLTKRIGQAATGLFGYVFLTAASTGIATATTLVVTDLFGATIQGFACQAVGIVEGLGIEPSNESRAELARAPVSRSFEASEDQPAVMQVEE